jgi:hypothetical protein
MPYVLPPQRDLLDDIRSERSERLVGGSPLRHAEQTDTDWSYVASQREGRLFGRGAAHSARKKVSTMAARGCGSRRSNAAGGGGEGGRGEGAGERDGGGCGGCGRWWAAAVSSASHARTFTRERRGRSHLDAADESLLRSATGRAGADAVTTS